MKLREEMGKDMEKGAFYVHSRQYSCNVVTPAMAPTVILIRKWHRIWNRPFFLGVVQLREFEVLWIVTSAHVAPTKELLIVDAFKEALQCNINELLKVTFVVRRAPFRRPIPVLSHPLLE